MELEYPASVTLSVYGSGDTCDTNIILYVVAVHLYSKSVMYTALVVILTRI